MNKKFLNYIFQNRNSSVIIKSISILHVVKLHSLFIKKEYKILSIIFKVFYRVVSIFMYFFKNLITKKKKEKKIFKKKILVISHIINANHLNAKSDFYYGNLENFFKKVDKSYYKLMINHTKYSSSYLNNKNKNKNLIILDKNLDVHTEIKIFIKKIVTVFGLIFLLLRQKLNFKEFFLLVISLFDSATTFTIRINYQIKNYVKKIKPDYCILTYEGYSWERMCINGIKSVNSKIQCIGYQHTPVTDNHQAIFNHMNGDFNPDKIWCSQLDSFKILKKKIYRQIRKNIFFIGNLKKEKINILGDKNKKSVLVIPEGIYSECEKLFKFSLTIAKKYKKFKFIWRVHPVIDFEKVLKNLKLKRVKLPKNIIISSNKFDKDASKSKYVIYKGSAAVIKSVLMGNYPIYFKSNKENIFDPLKNLFNKKNYVSDDKDFLNLLNKVKSKKYKKKLKDNIEFLKKNDFSSPNLRIIKNHLSN